MIHADVSVEGQAYEQALEMADELCTQHRMITWDAGKISELLAYQAKLWDQIRTSRRQKPEYYRVVSWLDRTLTELMVRHSTVISDRLYARVKNISSEGSLGSSSRICEYIRGVICGPMLLADR